MPANLDQLIRAAARQPRSLPDIDDQWQRGVRRRKLRIAVGGLAAAAVAAVVLGVGTLVTLGPARPHVADDTTNSDRAKEIESSGARSDSSGRRSGSTRASCARVATPETLRQQREAFDATVRSIERGGYSEEAAATPLKVTFEVNEWFKSSVDRSKVVVRRSWDFWPPGLRERVTAEGNAVGDAGGIRTNLQPGIAVGTRLLSAGDGNMVGSLQHEGCGFTLPYSHEQAAEWRTIFKAYP